jgi:hypothetical protein
VLTLFDIRSVSRHKGEDETDLPRLAGALTISLMGFLIGGFFLSRAYDVMLFMLLGLCIAMTSLARRQGYPSSSHTLAQRLLIIFVAEIASITVIWVYLRFF